MRDSDFDPHPHELEISGGGIQVGKVLRGAEAILSGYAREPKRVSSGVQPKRRNRSKE
jgi:hypothetical protein